MWTAEPTSFQILPNTLGGHFQELAQHLCWVGWGQQSWSFGNLAPNSLEPHQLQVLVDACFGHSCESLRSLALRCRDVPLCHFHVSTKIAWSTRRCSGNDFRSNFQNEEYFLWRPVGPLDTKLRARWLPLRFFLPLNIFFMHWNSPLQIFTAMVELPWFNH